MMDPGQWFREQLRMSALNFVWAVEQVPVERRMVEPLPPYGEWPVARHVFHMLSYEQQTALPMMRRWLSDGSFEKAPYDEDEAWLTAPPLDHLLDQFQAIRAEQIGLIEHFDPAAWTTILDTNNWGPVTLQWFVSKTFQHTLDHTNSVLQIALFWDPWLWRFGGKQE
jgi:hypothetical protein